MLNRARGLIEPVSSDRPSIGRILRDLGSVELANGTIGFLFAVTGPLAIILAVGSGAGLSEAQLASWIFGVFFINGLVSLVMTWAYRLPLCFFWTIPGTVLVGPAMGHLTFAEVVGAFIGSSALILLLALSGLAKRAMAWLPMPIVMGMVAGVFLQFGLGIVRALEADLWVAGPMLAAFLALSLSPRLGRLMPPIIGTLVVGTAMALALSRIDLSLVRGLTLAAPLMPEVRFSPGAMIELVVPIMITILVVQNGQGFAVLTQAGHTPPVTAVSLACGIGGFLSAAVGAVGTCLTGPTNGIITSSGARERHYAAAVVTGGLAVLFGLASPTFTSLMLAAPKALIMMLGGLAMLRVLQGAFTASFKGAFALGALVSFLVTVADIKLFNIGAPFWGLVTGTLVSLMLEPRDFAARG